MVLPIRCALLFSALASRAAGFATSQGSTCTALDGIIMVDGADPGTELNLRELLYSANALKAGGCGKFVAPDDVIKSRLETNDVNGDSGLDQNEVIDVLERINDVAEDALEECVGALYKAAGCMSSARRKLQYQFVNIRTLTKDALNRANEQIQQDREDFRSTWEVDSQTYVQEFGMYVRNFPQYVYF
eukprot:CAMPEP_0119354026 /NCGR_PEP_ID=MMETSP1334-20130426/3120_1 /TAXON_ID=127549 /ORGANISM="Calcidiscus leptoporus, Strain RCC1130" /LENGTH=187 /DNA_ID=CAMNT_0007367475 /DNA_START=53 /DNA_END=616 /DNA_ORIENTATION=+